MLAITYFLPLIVRQCLHCALERKRKVKTHKTRTCRVEATFLQIRKCPILEGFQNSIAVARSMSSIFLIKITVISDKLLCNCHKIIHLGIFFYIENLYQRINNSANIYVVHSSMKNFFRSSVLFNNSKRASTLHLYKTRTSSGVLSTNLVKFFRASIFLNTFQ